MLPDFVNKTILNLLVIFILFSSLANAQTWWLGPDCTGLYYCDVGAITPTTSLQTIPSSSFCAVTGGTSHSNDFTTGTSLYVQCQFTVGVAGTIYCFSLSTQGSSFDASGSEIDILETACGGAGNMIATTYAASCSNCGYLPGGNELDNCLTWTATSFDAGKVYYIQLSDDVCGCYEFGVNGCGTCFLETVYFSYMMNGGCICSNGKVLPIDLISFTGENAQNGVLLNWQTATELNNDYFTIERSPDVKEWTEIGKVKGAGNSSTSRDYDFIDAELPSPVGEGLGVGYYRLKQTDYNGQFEYFGPISVSLAPSEEWKLIIKNPAGDELKGTLFAAEDAKIMVEIFDLQGRNVHSERLNAVKGSNLLQVNLAGIEQGAYFVVIHSSQNKIQSKFVKVN